MKRCVSMILVLCVLAMCLLTGCHSSNGVISFVIPETFDTSRTYEIDFWAKNDTNKLQTAIYAESIQKFEALYPNIKVNIRPYTDYSRIYNDVITNIATNTTPNVCITYPDHIATYLTGNHCVIPLDELFTHEKYGLGGSEVRFDSPKVGEIVPQFLNECKIGTQHYAVPYMRSTEAMYINKTYVEALGYELPEVLTWDFVWEVSEAAMAKDEEGKFLVNGQTVMIPFIYKSTDNMMIQMLKQLNAPYSTSAGEIQIFNDVTRSILFEVAEHGASRAFSTFKISSYPANFLNAGQCIFAVDSTAGATWMGTDAPLLDIAEDQLAEFEIEVKMIPQFDPENPKMISQGPSLCIFNKEDPQEVLASWLFMQFMLTNEVQIAYSSTEGYIPVTTKAQSSAEYQDYLSRRGEDNQHYYPVKIDAAKLMIDNVENTFVTPVFNGSASLRNAAGQLIEEAVKKVRRRETMSDELVDTLFEGVTQLYRLDQIDQDGPLPAGSIALLSGIAAVWVLMGAYVIRERLKGKK